MQHLFSALGDLERIVRSKSHLLLATDFDGTLCPIARSPASVKVPRRTEEVLRELAATESTTVAIVSGRALVDIMSMLPIDAVHAGNHGLEIRGKGIRFQHDKAEVARPLLAEVCSGLEVSLAPWDGAWVENKGLTATVHYRWVRDADQNTVVVAVRAHMQRFDSVFGMRSGRKAIEIYPRVAWGKGQAVQYIREQLAINDALCICIGDDETDESMFAAFLDDVCIRVALEKPTIARYHLNDCTEVLEVLEHLCAWRGACILGNRS